MADLGYWRPWIQVHNARECEWQKNAGMIQWKGPDLANRVAEARAQGKTECRVFENYNVVAHLVSTMNLRTYPFDAQVLRMTLISSPTSQILLTHRVIRDPSGKPKNGPDGKPVNTIKANLENLNVTEWAIVTPPGVVAHQELGSSAPASSAYRVTVHNRAFSAESEQYNRLDVFLMVSREIKPALYSLVLPVFLLSLGSFSIFALDVDDSARYATLFTSAPCTRASSETLKTDTERAPVILTLVAQSFVADSRLPRLPYLTLLDFALLGMQLFVWLLVLESSVVRPVAASLSMDPDLVDQYASYFFAVLYCLMILVFALISVVLYARRGARVERFIKEGDACFDREEYRAQMVMQGRRVTVVPRRGDHGFESDVVEGDGPGSPVSAVTATVEPRQ